MMRLRAIERGDVPALVAIHRAIVGPVAAWSAAVLEDLLWNPGHADGRNAVVAVDGRGAVAGVAGWIAVGREFFGSPVLARDHAAAELLVGELVSRARAAGAAWIRIGCADGEPHKRAALVARGFEEQLHFSMMTCAPAPRPTIRPSGLEYAPLASVEPAVLIEIHDASMLEIDNTGPMSVEAARHLQARAWGVGSGVWLDGDSPAAFLVLIRDREPVDHVLIDQIGVAPRWRRLGIARILVERALDRAALDGATEVRAIIASTNHPSLALHQAAGFQEAWRLEVLQLTF
jgi:ribosomal protein S18 acetylase RimI-like enzyme